MSSPKRRLVIGLPPMLTMPSGSSKRSVVILSRNMLKWVGENRQPRRTPAVVRDQSPMLPLKRTALAALPKKCLTTRIRLPLILYFFMVAHEAAFQILSKAFLKSVKTWWKSCWCRWWFSQRILRLKICSVVLLPALKHVCFSAMISARSSAWVCLMADEADRSVVLALLQVAFRGKCDG